MDSLRLVLDVDRVAPKISNYGHFVVVVTTIYYHSNPWKVLLSNFFIIEMGIFMRGVSVPHINWWVQNLEESWDVR